MDDKRKRLVRLFTFERPFALKYERLKRSHKADRVELSKMIKEGLIEIEEKDRRFITYRYVEQLG